MRRILASPAPGKAPYAFAYKGSSFSCLLLFAFALFALLWPLRGNTRTPKPFALRSGLAFYRIGKRLP